MGDPDLTTPESLAKLPAEGWADVGDLRVRYLDWASGGPPVVALHGLASSGHWYDLVAPLLSDSYRIIAPDQRGHGKTTQASGGYDWPTLASDVAGLMDRLELDRAVVMGHSWGGHVAIAMAAYHPERVSGLVMIDGGFLDPHLSPGATWEGFSHRVSPRDVSGTRREFLDRLRSQLAGCWSDEVERIVQTMVYEDGDGQIRDILHPDHHAQVIRAMWDYPPSNIMPKISCPTLIVPAGPTPDRAGSEFARMRQVMVEAAAQAVKGCRVNWIPNTIHDIGYDKPGELASVIRGFLAEE
jgi:pimeloyl-ACP methyl ester carboxylesterase